MTHFKEFYCSALQPYDFLAEIALPVMKGTNGCNHLDTCGVLQYVAMRTSLHGTLNVLTGMVHRKDCHFRVCTDFTNLSCGFDSVHDRHGNIHQYDVRAVNGSLLYGLLSVGGCRDDLDIACSLQQVS